MLEKGILFRPKLVSGRLSWAERGEYWAWRVSERLLRVFAVGSQFIIMGNSGCLAEEAQEEERIEVQAILDGFPSVLHNSMFRGSTTRYSDLSVLHEDYNRYIFVLKLDGVQEIRVVIPVINELSHRGLHPNYKLTIGRDMVIDPFDERLESALVPVKNETTGLEFSMRVVRFRGYNSPAFKRVLEEVWLYQNIQKHFQRHKMDQNLQDPRLMFLWLEDCFVYGVNPDEQAVVMLYERAQTSLALAAEYRQKAGKPWRLSERLKIERDLFMASIQLQELDIVHRDMRASSIFYSQKHQRYLLGGFACARHTYSASEEEELMTVNGVEAQNQGRYQELIAQKQNMGLYRVGQLVYNQLRMVNRLLDSRRIADQLGPSEFKDKLFATVEQKLAAGDSLEAILKVVEGGLKGANRTGELEAEAAMGKEMYRLLPLRQKQLSQEYLFIVYCALGYQIQFSEMAHRMIERNNLEGKAFSNARVLKELGLFYQKYGTGGSEYLLNSCVLFCREADSKIERGLFEEAKDHLEQGEEIYIIMSTVGDFELTMIELKRLRAELRARTLWQVGTKGTKEREEERTEVLQLMSKTLELAADQNLPIQKQMKLFLTWGVVHRECGDRAAAEERFQNGLAVCENPGAFENQQSASLMKSHFLYEFVEMKLEDLQVQHDPLLAQEKQVYSPEDLAKVIENWLREGLQIREKQSPQPYQAVQCCLLLGKLYMLESEYLQAKVQLKRALIRLVDIQITSKVLPEILVQLHYDLGSVSYKLQDYQESVDHYREAINLQQNSQGDSYWTDVIAGNLGLAYMRAGLRERGKTLLERSKETIRATHGAHHYDFLFLTSQEQLINHTIPS